MGRMPKKKLINSREWFQDFLVFVANTGGHRDAKSKLIVKSHLKTNTDMGQQQHLLSSNTVRGLKPL